MLRKELSLVSDFPRRKIRHNKTLSVISVNSSFPDVLGKRARDKTDFNEQDT
jgi:hypothetical protein